MKEVVVVSAARTAIGSIGGTLVDVLPEELLKVALQGAVDKGGVDKKLVDEVIAGHTKQTTDAPNITRVSSLMMGLPEEVPSYTIHRQCASGMQAMLNGAQQIQCGYSETILAGGVESMSTAPFYIRGARFGVGSGNQQFLDPNVESQPKSQPAEYGISSMIWTADEVARRYNVSREAQDEFALQSQKRAIDAMDNGRFRDEIVPVMVKKKKADVAFEVDEYPKRDTDLEKLAKLKPINKDGFVTAGNASGRNDGAAAVVLMSADKAAALGLKPMAKIIGASAVGVDPKIMGISPVPATLKLMKYLEPRGLKLSDFGLLEINEAFAAQAVACVNELKVDPAKVNVNGGAIALGHPLGCSGTRICVTLMHEMRRRNVKHGLAAICVAGGLGMAMAFELM